jgi:DNA-binding LacI/PurR family transcriptional regulator
MATTLKDIAKFTGLAVSTVSNILANDDPRYSEATRTRVLEAAEKLDYHPQRAARIVQGRRSGTIGVLVPDMSYSYFPDILYGVEQEADARDLQIIVCQSHYDESQEARKLSLLRQHRVDGLVLFPIPFGRGNWALFRRLKSSNVPVVCVDSEVSGVPFDLVGTDDYHGALAAVEHLTLLGHTRIVCLAFGDESPISVARHRGYEDALTRNGIAVDPSLTIAGPWSLDTPATELLGVFEREPRPTAVFAMSDLLGVWAYCNLKEAGREIPREASIIGFGGLHEGRWLDTPLTTVTQDRETMGRAAVQLLCRRMEAPQRDVERVLLTPQLTIRASCCAPGNVPTDYSLRDEFRALSSQPHGAQSAPQSE